jgi:hypothetical protein
MSVVKKIKNVVLTAIIVGALGYGSKEYFSHKKDSRLRKDLAAAHEQMLNVYVRNGSLPKREQLDFSHYSSAISYQVIDGEYLIWAHGFDEKDDLGPAIQGKSKQEIEQLLIDNSVQDAKGHPFYWFGDRENGDMFLMKDYKFSKLVKNKEGSFLEQLFCMIDSAKGNETKNIEALLRNNIKNNVGNLKNNELELLVGEILKINPNASVSDIEYAAKNNFDLIYNEAMYHFNKTINLEYEVRGKKKEIAAAIDKDHPDFYEGSKIMRLNFYLKDREYASKIIEEAEKTSALMNKALGCDKNNEHLTEVKKNLDTLDNLISYYNKRLKQTREDAIKSW